MAAKHTVKSKMLLSLAYGRILEKPLSKADSDSLGLSEGTMWGDAIANQVVRRAVGLVPDDKVCFKAITELRETTEGKTPEKIIAAGTNAELANLAHILSEPAPDEPEPQQLEAGEYDAEEDFHSSSNEE